MGEPKEIQRWMCKRCGAIAHTELDLYPEPGECERSNRSQLPPHNWVKNGQISREEYHEYLREKKAEYEAYMELKAKRERRERIKNIVKNMGCLTVIIFLIFLFWAMQHAK